MSERSQNGISKIGTLIYSNVEIPVEEKETEDRTDLDGVSIGMGNRSSNASPTVVKFSSDSSHLVYGLYDGRVIVRTVDSWQKVLEVNAHEGFVTGIVLLDDGKRIISSSIDGSMIIRDIVSGKEVKRWNPAESYVPIFSIGITRNEEYIIADTWETRIVNATSLVILRVFPEGHPLGFISVPTPDSKKCFMCSEEHPISLWEIGSGKRVMTLKNRVGNALSLTMTSNGRYLVVGNINGTIDLWDAKTGKKLKTMAGRHRDRIVSIAVSKDDKYLASGAWDKTVKIWDIENGRVIKSIKAHNGSVNSVAISPDNRYIASGGEDSTVKIWGSEG